MEGGDASIPSMSLRNVQSVKFLSNAPRKRHGRNARKKVDQIDDFLREEIERLRTLPTEAPLATQQKAGAKTKQFRRENRAAKAQANLDIAKKRMPLPGRWWSEGLMTAKYHALNRDAMKEAR